MTRRSRINPGPRRFTSRCKTLDEVERASQRRSVRSERLSKRSFPLAWVPISKTAEAKASQIASRARGFERCSLEPPPNNALHIQAAHAFWFYGRISFVIRHSSFNDLCKSGSWSQCAAKKPWRRPVNQPLPVRRPGNVADPDRPPQHVYLREAVQLRQDLQGAQ